MDEDEVRREISDLTERVVDIAQRSMSDSPLQDPTTAVQAIDRLHDCLRQIARRPPSDGLYRDSAGEIRLMEPVLDWDAYVHLAFDEIRIAGATSPQVSRRLTAALRDLTDVAPAGPRPGAGAPAHTARRNRPGVGGQGGRPTTQHRVSGVTSRQGCDQRDSLATDGDSVD